MVTLFVGAGLTLAPGRAAAALRLGDHPGFAKSIGAADLVMATGLLAGRSQWSWMATRSARNALVAHHYWWLGGSQDGARSRMWRMLALTLIDGSIATVLRTKRM